MGETEESTVKMELILHRVCGIGSNVTFTEIQSDIGSFDRLTMVWDAFFSWLEVNQGASLTYFLPHAIDLTVAHTLSQLEDAKRAERNLPARITFDEAESDKIFMTTYGDWTLKHGSVSGSLKRQLFILDMGFGVYTADMVVAAAKLLHSLKGIMNSDTRDQTVSWLAISSEATQSLLDKRIFTTVLGCEAAPKVTKEVIVDKRSFCKSHTSDIHRWLGPKSDPQDDTEMVETAVDVILDRLRDIKGQDHLAIACIMSHPEVNELIQHLKGSCQPKLLFIETWTDAKDLDRAVVDPHVEEDSEGPPVILVLINHEVSLLPAIYNLTDVIVAPTLDGMAFDHAMKDMVATRVMSNQGFHLAKSLRNGRSDVTPIVHTWPDCGAKAVCLLREACTSPAFDKELAYLMFSLANTFPGMNPYKHYPVRLPQDEEMLSHCGALLGMPGMGPLIEPGNTSETCERLYVMSPDALRVAKYVCFEANFHALRLFGAVTVEQPWYINRILIQLAVLISLGIPSILDTFQELSPQDKIVRIQEAGEDSVQDLGYRGEIWISLAALRMLSKVEPVLDNSTNNKSKSELRFLEMIRLDVGNEALHRVSQWSEKLSVSLDGAEPERLSPSELIWIEKRLALAMGSSELLIPNQARSYFARHMQTMAVFEKQAIHGYVDWCRVMRETQGRPIKAICPRVERVVVNPSKPNSPIYYVKEVVVSPR